jgi:hypothetical protein
MPEIGTSGSMSGDGKRRVAAWTKLPRPSSTLPNTPRSLCLDIPDFFTAGKLAPGHLGLLQQYLPTADLCTATKSNLLDHLVGGDQQARRHGQAERLRSLEIEDSFIPGWRLHRKLGGVGAAQDAVNI